MFRPSKKTTNVEKKHPRKRKEKNIYRASPT